MEHRSDPPIRTAYADGQVSTEAIEEAAQVLRRGGLVAMPTETVYGLAASALDAEAAARIFQAKRRPEFDPLIVHVTGLEQLDGLADASDERVERLASCFWPGPLTLVLPKRRTVPDIVTAGLGTVAVRAPQHAVALSLIEHANLPLAAPSANPFGYLSPTSAEHVARMLGPELELILDGGACTIGVESTIVDLTGASPRILRAGGLDPQRIEAEIGPLQWPDPEDDSDTPHDGQHPDPSPSPAAPGRLRHHYAPRTPLRLLDGPARPPNGPVNRGLLAFHQVDPVVAHAYRAVETLSDGGDLVQAAARLFAALHRLDGLGLEGVDAEPVPEQGLGHAIMDRLRRAAAK